ncbi:type VII secretion target [Nocardia rhizosphaerae]|uniref:Type VII secretion target n=1 Tax=Nocardia rhizosphaerae TaxID=1691571 RepID=A0ABV8L565_9NOCA
MLVDPAILRTFATSVDEASRTVSATDLAGKIAAVFDGLPGSQAQWAAKRAGAVVQTPLNEFAGDIASMGEAVRGAAGTYEVTDEELAGGFNALQTEDPCAKGWGLGG